MFRADKVADAYICKVTSVGQITLPKEIRKELNIKGDDFVILEKIGKTYFLRKVGIEKDILKKLGHE